MLQKCNALRKLAVLLLLTTLPMAPMGAAGQANSAVRLASADVQRLTPAAAEIRKALLAGGKAYTSLREFYASRAYEPIWTGRKKTASRALIKALENADDHGLPVARYSVVSISRQLKSARSKPDKARAELAASVVFLKYAHDLSSGLINPRRIDSEIALRRPRRSDASLLIAIANARKPNTVFRSLQPAHPNYNRLLDEKKRLARVVAKGGWGEKIPGGDTLKPGMQSNRIPLIRARLTRMGIGRRLGNSTTYDAKLATAVKLFQNRHGLNTDAVIGRGTLAAMNASPQQRYGQVLVNLERERWMNFDRGARHIYVNLAAFTVKIFDDGRETYSSRVVAGKARDFRTPEFSDSMTHMVINPVWNVPDSIATEELLPAIQEDPDYLAKMNMRILTRTGQELDPSTVNFTDYSQETFPYIIKQRPGGGNALGRVKFMFPNRFNIYLHDTPAKRLFSRDNRAYSHGCVRVQKPLEFAYKLLEGRVSNPKKSFANWLATGKESFINLAAPVPVHLSYHTAWIDEKGTPQYRADVYGRDKRVIRALRKAGVSI